MKKIIWFLFPLLMLGCTSKPKEVKFSVSVERLDPALDSILSSTVTIETIATGFDWTEGPLWVNNMLIFSDVPRNTIYKWTPEKGAEVYLTPSGYTGTTPRGGEPGSNGLTIDDEGNLLLCQHGDRRIAMMNAGIEEPLADFTTIADNYQGKKFNSPNDLVYGLNGDILFTDPPYGLEKQQDDPAKEIPFQGVYNLTREGKTILLTDTLTRPNGIAFSPDGKKVYVANSDPNKARWYEYSLNDSSQFVSGKIFYDATSETNTGKGLPDGLKVDSKGNIFATGPAGIWIFNSEGKVLGKIKVTEATSNCALTPDEKTLFVTNDMNVLRIKLRD